MISENDAILPILLAFSTLIIFLFLVPIANHFSGQKNWTHSKKETMWLIGQAMFYGFYGVIPTTILSIIGYAAQINNLIILAQIYATTFPLTLVLYKYADNHTLDLASDNFNNQIILNLSYMSENDKQNFRRLIQDVMKDK